jgi:hypothetical protein
MALLPIKPQAVTISFNARVDNFSDNSSLYITSKKTNLMDNAANHTGIKYLTVDHFR